MNVKKLHGILNVAFNYIVLPTRVPQTVIYPVYSPFAVYLPFWTMSVFKHAVSAVGTFLFIFLTNTIQFSSVIIEIKM